VGIDFDGTIAEHTGNILKPGKIMPGAKEALQKFKDIGCHVVIISCRNSPSVFEDELRTRAMASMKEFLDKNEIPYDEIDDGTKGKMYTHLFIDNAALRFTGDWSNVLPLALELLGVDADIVF
jgi:soluble P-type ATPase